MQPLKPSMQTEWYCLAVHKNPYKRTLEYAGVDEQVAEKSLISSSSSSSSSFFLSFSYKTLRNDSLPTKPLLELIYAQDNTAIAVALALTTFVCKLARPAVIASYDPMAF